MLKAIQNRNICKVLYYKIRARLGSEKKLNENENENENGRIKRRVKGRKKERKKKRTNKNEATFFSIFTVSLV